MRGALVRAKGLKKESPEISPQAFRDFDVSSE